MRDPVVGRAAEDQVGVRFIRITPHTHATAEPLVVDLERLVVAAARDDRSANRERGELIDEPFDFRLVGGVSAGLLDRPTVGVSDERHLLVLRAE